MRTTTTRCDIHLGEIDEGDEVTIYEDDGLREREFQRCRACHEHVKDAIKALIERLADPLERLWLAKPHGAEPLPAARTNFLNALPDLSLGQRFRDAIASRVSSIDELEALPDVELLELPGIGAGRLAKIRAAVARYREAQRKDQAAPH